MKESNTERVKVIVVAIDERKWYDNESGVSICIHSCSLYAWQTRTWSCNQQNIGL